MFQLIKIDRHGFEIVTFSGPYSRRSLLAVVWDSENLFINFLFLEWVIKQDEDGL